MTETGTSGERWQQGPERPKTPTSSDSTNPWIVGIVIVGVLLLLVGLFLVAVIGVTVACTGLLFILAGLFLRAQRFERERPPVA